MAAGGRVELRLERAAEGLRNHWCHGVARVVLVLWSSRIDDRCKLQNKSKQSPRGNSTKTLRRDFFKFKSISSSPSGFIRLDIDLIDRPKKNQLIWKL